MHNAKRPIALLLVLCMLLSVLPVSALAISISDKPANGTTKGQPFAAGTAESTNFRIPGLITLDNGRVIATIDARWSWAADAGGIDTLVSVSDDNGANWTYTFANYLGDNGNVANNTSCCFIDPAIATDGTTAYMIADLYPAGFAINSAKYYAQPGSTGFDANGHLLLRSDAENGITFGNSGYENGAKNATYGYYLDGGKIYTTAGAEVEGYTVDAYFNITGNGIDTNLFFGDSPYKPFPTDFLYMTTSTDGLNWSEPELLDVKAPEEQSYLVGPGNGTYHEANDHMIFTAYRHTGGASGTAYECTSLIWMDAEGNWHRSEDATRNNWSSEATAVVLADGTVRVFYRDGFTTLRYTDYVYDEDVNNYVVTACEVSTDATVDSGCQLTAIMYSKQIDGKDVILFAGPTSSRRINGYIYAFLVDENNDMELAYAYNVTPDAYAYSCLTELANGDVALLYEDAGASVKYITIPFAQIANRANDPDLTVQKLDLLEGYSKTVTDASGYYVGADISELDTAVATLTMTGEEIFTDAAQLGSNATYSGNVIDLADCLYTFTKGADDRWTVAGADGTVYLYPGNTSVTGYPNRDTAYSNLSIFAGYEEDTFCIMSNDCDNANQSTSYLFFDANSLRWDRVSAPGTNAQWQTSVSMMLYKSVAGAGSAEIPGYERVTSADELVDGEYLVVRPGNDGNYYALYPNASTANRYCQIAKLLGRSTVGHTELTFTGVAEGYTEVVVGSTLYQITVHAVDVVDLEIHVGESITLTDTNGDYSNADTSALDGTVATVTMTGIAGTAENGLSLAPVSELTDGKYVILNTRANKLVTNAPVSAEAAAGAGAGLKLNGAKTDEVAADAVWTITGVEGGYTIQDLNGKYMTIASNSASVVDAAAAISLNWGGSSWTIAQNGAYLNHFGGGGSICAAGWQNASAAGDAGSQFALYTYSEEPVSASTELTFTAVAEGYTEVLIGHTRYLITVTEGAEPTDPVEPTDPTDPVEPTDPTDPVEPTDPTDPVEPTDPTDPTEPTVPIEPPVIEPGDDSWDIPLSDLTVSCGDYEPNGGASEGPAYLAVDGNNATMWHTDWEGTSREDHWFQFEVKGDYSVCGLRYLPRQTGNSNGTITEYDIQVSDDGVNFRSVKTGNWEANSSWKIALFSAEKVKYVRLVSVDAVTDNAWVFASAAEIRLTYQPDEISDADKTELNALIAECELIEEGNYTAKTWQKFQKALDKALAVSANAYASQTQVDEALEALAQAKAGLKEKVEGEGVEKILHLDSGRKYFSKDWHIALLNELAAAGYTHVQLAFGNNGFRFLLDDMTIEANGTTYASDDIKEGVRIGNYNYGALTGYYSDDHALTEAEMDEIIAHGKAVGVEIIPHLNMPGHMSALLDAMEHVGIENPHFYGREESDSSVDLTNEAAINFMYALTEKYAAYFAERGVKYFHIGADEYANDAYNGNMGFPSMGAALYQKFADFVNNNAAIVKSHGMTPRAWNDGLYYGSYTSEFDTDIEINYWSSGWWGYTLAKASTLNDKGHGLINTNGDYYYILGKDDRFTPGSSSEHDPNLYTECAGYDLTRFMDGSIIEEPVGGMFCVWADYPGAETEQEVGANIRLVLRAMALRMEGLDLDGMNTDVVPGGFNEDGSINSTGEQPVPHVHKYVPVVTDPTCTEGGYTTYTCECGESYIADETEALGHDYVEGVCARCGEEDPNYEKPVVNPFVDVPEDIYFYEPVMWAVENDITKGTDDTHFSPDAAVNRAQVVTFLWRAAGKPEPTTTENPFVDVAEGDFFYKAVLWAVENGITKGVDAEHFAPTLGCNRAQVVTFLWRANGSPASEAEIAFTDVVPDAFYATAVAWAVENGITNGVAPTAFGVDGICNRAQVVTFLYRAASK